MTHAEWEDELARRVAEAEKALAAVADMPTPTSGWLESAADVLAWRGRVGLPESPCGDDERLRRHAEAHADAMFRPARSRIAAAVSAAPADALHFLRREEAKAAKATLDMLRWAERELPKMAARGDEGVIDPASLSPDRTQGLPTIPLFRRPVPDWLWRLLPPDELYLDHRGDGCLVLPDEGRAAWYGARAVAGATRAARRRQLHPGPTQQPMSASEWLYADVAAQKARLKEEERQERLTKQGIEARLRLLESRQAGAT